MSLPILSLGSTRWTTTRPPVQSLIPCFTVVDGLAGTSAASVTGRSLPRCARRWLRTPGGPTPRTGGTGLHGHSSTTELPCPPRRWTWPRYLVAHAGPGDLAVGTLTRRLSAVSKAYLLAGHADPADDAAAREVPCDLRRQHGAAKKGAPPLWTSDLERIVAATLLVPSPHGAGQGLAEVRDRALLLLAFSTAVRRSELSALDLADLEPTPPGWSCTFGAARPTRPARAAT